MDSSAQQSQLDSTFPLRTDYMETYIREGSHSFIDNGTFGNVYLATNKGDKLAIKTAYIALDKIMRSSQQISDIASRLSFIKDPKHPFILNLLDTYRNPENMAYFISEFSEIGNLDCVMRNRTKNDEVGFINQ